MYTDRHIIAAKVPLPHPATIMVHTNASPRRSQIKLGVIRLQSSASHRLQSGPQAQASTGDNFPLKQTQINTDSSIIEASTPGPAPPWKCPFTEDIGYLVFSSTVSFYGPLAVMVFTYIRIYQVGEVGRRV